MAQNKQEKELSFEEALNKLEKIVEELNSDLLSLEEAMDKFSEGVKLIKYCQGELNQAEGKIEQILEEDDEFKEIIPFQLSGEETKNQEDD
ncbi:MAG: exodeoxyribonuclease VII small subunit [Bacillota bacterium]